MPTGRFLYHTLPKYPHMKPEDVLTWERFITQYPNEYISVDYDLPLGDVSEHAALAEQLDIAGVETLHKYKIDAVAYRANTTDIIEVKGRATPGALGQVVAYRTLYLQEFKPAESVYMVVIARTATPGLAEIAREMGVLLIIV